jgi:hypothetical protein
MTSAQTEQPALPNDDVVGTKTNVQPSVTHGSLPVGSREAPAWPRATL